MDSMMAEVTHLNSVEQHIRMPLRTVLTLHGLDVLAVHFTTNE
jgi:hypothetical protein